jgi:hypothetical protein
MSVAKDRGCALIARLRAYGMGTKDYWSFRSNAAREHAHAYFQYPAMMVPQMQADLLSAAVADDPSTKHVYDPFVGSGTVLTESMKLGLDFTGQDINPLAVLVCRAKMIPHFHAALSTKVEKAIEAARSDRCRAIELQFAGWPKWFKHRIAIALSRLRRAIRSERELWARRFLWVALAETVRQTSNSRTSTFKLHIRLPHEIEALLSPIDVFTRVCNRNLANFVKQKEFLSARGLLNRGIYQGRVEVFLANTSAASSAGDRGQYDLLLTSPPYGDNASTVTYGQHSYLPLQWIDLQDIDPRVDPNYLGTTHAIDSLSLGGSRRIDPNDIVTLRTLSRTFGATLARLTDEPHDRSARVSAFCRDLNNCIDPILQSLRPKAPMIWIVGNRRVGTHPIPLDKILEELLRARGADHLMTIQRTIPSKRTALRNNTDVTMQREAIVILKKAA